MKNRTASPPLPVAAASPTGRWLMPLAVAAVALLGLIVYRAALVPGHIILTTDDNIGAIALRKAALPHALTGWWDDSVLCGQPVPINISWTNLLIWLLPATVFTNWIHAIDLFAASFFLMFFLRQRRIHPAAALLAALVSFWLGSTFFLTYAGHIGKFGVIVFAAFYLWQIECAFRRRSWANAVLAGGGMGGMFLEQADVALFFALPLGCYALYRLMVSGSEWRPNAVRVFMPAVVVAAMMAIHPVWLARSMFSAAGPGTTDAGEKARWDYCTQWSWPPEESIEWIAPGYYGWRSGEPDGPYWGRLGRAAGWETTRQGFMNFKLETFYIGVIPIVLALLAVVLAFARRTRGERDRGEILFWFAVAGITFLLGLGKFSPLYRAFFALPGMSSIRNPVKFMQVTQLAIGILAAYGFDWLIRATAADARTKVFQSLRWIALGAAVILFLAGFGAAAGEQSRIQHFAAQGWGAAAPVIVSNQIAALLRAAGMALLAWGLLLLLPRDHGPWPVWRTRIAWAAVAIVMLDQLLVSRHYVQTVRTDDIVGDNAVTEHLKAHLGSQRAYLIAQESFYNHWLTYLFPYHHIPTFNVTQIRMPEDYQRFLSAVGKTPDRLWRQFAVGTIVGPTAAWPQVQRMPGAKDAATLAMTFNVSQQGDGIAVHVAPSSQPGSQMIARMGWSAPRYALIGHWDVSADEATLSALANPAVPLFETARIAAEPPAKPPERAIRGIVGEVEVVNYRSGAVTLRTRADQPAILRASERYTAHWKAWVDGRPVPLIRCDYLFQGVFVPAGEHEVRLNYAPPLFTLWVQFAGMGLCAVALVVLALERLRSRSAVATT